jgi:hypothetical protein
MGHEKVARVRSIACDRGRPAVGGGGRNADSTTVDYVTVQSLNAVILTPERISQVAEREYHKDTCKREAGYFFVAHSVQIVCNCLLTRVVLSPVLVGTAVSSFFVVPEHLVVIQLIKKFDLTDELVCHRCYKSLTSYTVVSHYTAAFIFVTHAF